MLQLGQKHIWLVLALSDLASFCENVEKFSHCLNINDERLMLSVSRHD